MKGLLRWDDKQAPYRTGRKSSARTITLDDLRRQIDEATRKYEAMTRRIKGDDPALAQCEQVVRDALNLFYRDLQEAECALVGADPDRAAGRLKQAFGHLDRASAAVGEYEEQA